MSGVDPRVSEYIARSLLLASGYLAEAGEGDLSALRAEQARALAEAYDLDLPDTPEELATLLDEADAALAKDAESTMDVLGYGTEPVIPANTIEAPLDSRPVGARSINGSVKYGRKKRIPSFFVAA